MKFKSLKSTMRITITLILCKNINALQLYIYLGYADVATIKIQ